MHDEPTHAAVAFGSQRELGDEDLRYVSGTFRPQTQTERRRAAARVSQMPAYLLPDGTPMVSLMPDADLAAATDAADLRRRFTTRWQEAGGPPGELEEELASWLDGSYSVCLPSPGPELILAKAGIAQAITALIARPLPQQERWRRTLRGAVEAYDALVLPFASIDPARFGRPTSRTLLVDAVRARWPDVFATPAAEA